jgi:autophagy-related protein 5
MHTRPGSTTDGLTERDGAFNVRCIPVRIYLPDGPVLQDLVPPVLEDG